MAARRRRFGSFWPSRRQELLLRAALLEDERGEEAWRTLRPQLDIERLDQGSTVLLPLLYERLRERGAEEPFLPRLKGVYRYVWYRDQVAMRALRELLTALRSAGIETLVFGGAALVTRYYGRLGVRPVDEAAVLVRRDRLDDAVTLLTGAGWTITSGGSGRHHRLQRPESRDGGTAALHWRLPVELEPIRRGAEDDYLWRDAVEHDVQGAPALMLSPTDELLLTCVRGTRSGSTSNVQWIVDAVTILEVTEPEINWEALIAKAVARGRTPALLEALRYLAETLDAPVPEATLDTLDATPPTRRERFAHRLGGRGGRVLGNLPATVGAHVIASQDENVFRVALTLPEFMRREWGLDRVSQLPIAAARRGAAAVSSERAHRRTRRLVQRQRSASSSGT